VTNEPPQAAQGQPPRAAPAAPQPADLRARLADARLYLCTDARRSTGDLAQFHLGQDDLPVPVARRILGPGPLIGRSSHDPGQAGAAAAEPGADDPAAAARAFTRQLRGSGWV